jgi:hypothetical protein
MITLESPTSLNPAIRTGSLRKKLQVICDHVYQFFTMLPCHFLAFQFLKLTTISSFRHLFCCKHIERLLAEVWLTNKATKFLPGKKGARRSQRLRIWIQPFRKKKIRKKNSVSHYVAFPQKKNVKSSLIIVPFSDILNWYEKCQFWGCSKIYLFSN